MLKSIVLLSGGMDSAVALYWAARNTDVKAILHFDYGQRARAHEFRSALSLVKDLGVPTSMIQIITVPRFPKESRKVFTAGRNLVFLALATPYAFIHKADLVVGGWCQADGDDYPDCRKEFLASASRTIHLALGGDPKRMALPNVFSPVLSLNKEATIHMGDHQGVPWELTRTCYRNQPDPCNECASCLGRIRAFQSLDRVDPLYSTEGWGKVIAGL